MTIIIKPPRYDYCGLLICDNIDILPIPTGGADCPMHESNIIVPPNTPTHGMPDRSMATDDREAVGTVADPSEHLRELLQFVVQHRWVHDVQLTRFVELKWWEQIPTEVGQK